MYDAREVLKEFEERYSWLFKYGISYVKLIDKTTVVVSFTNGNTYVFDSSREIYDLTIVRLIDDPNRELSSFEWCLGFSYWLRKRMENKGIDEDSLAKITGISKRAIARYMNGTARPSNNLFNKLCRALRCYEEDLLPHEFIPQP